MVRALTIERLRRAVESAGSASSALPADRTRELLPLFAVCLFAVVLVKNAWLADDAFASFRAASNLVTGHGLLSNPPERVQAFTNPLWTLLFAACFAVVRNAYALAMFLAFACSLATVALVAYSRRVDPLARFVAVLALSGSAAFVEYSTSGLENPLAHLLLAAVFVSARNERALWLVSLLGALLAVNRLDHVLLVVPVLLARLARGGRAGLRQRLAQVALGFVPLVLWSLFSLVYYGFPFPNTAYSKLNAAISAGQFMSQGAWYLVECASRDPLTALVILLGIVAPIVTRDRLLLPYALGVLLYLLYVVRVGGDFMAGRFLTAPFLLALLVLFHGVVPTIPGPLTRLAAAVVLFVPLAARSSPLEESEAPTCVISESGITDERDCYREHTALSENMRKSKYKKHDYWQRGVEYRKEGGVRAENVVGLTSFAAGPDVHLVDLFGLTDPLLARTPYEPNGSDWRIGHFYRTLPDGYVESIESGKNRIKDRCLAQYYDRLKLVTRGPIWSWERFEEIYWLNVRERTVTPCPAPG